MKADESRSPLPVKHQLDHELPTVIHHPEEDMPLLALAPPRDGEPDAVLEPDRGRRARHWSG